MITKKDFTPITRDVNGNPRYVIHFLNCVKEKEIEHAKKNCKDWLDVLYLLGLTRVKAFVGGKKYHNKKYGGGIVIQTYNLQNEVDVLNKVLFDESEQAK